MTDSNELCAICGEGQLHVETVKNAVEYRGCLRELDLQMSRCDVCGSEQSDASQLRINKRTMMAFRKQVDGLLTGAEVRALREKLGLSQIAAAKVFGGGPDAGVLCQGCNAEGPYHYSDDENDMFDGRSAEYWNIRAYLPWLPPELVERIRKLQQHDFKKLKEDILAMLEKGSE